MRGVGRGRRETEMDGVKSRAVWGHSYGERQVTDAQRRSGRGFGKMTSQEVGEGGIMSKDGEEGVCVCVRNGETEAWRETWRKIGKFIGMNLKRRRRNACRKVKNMEIRELF